MAYTQADLDALDAEIATARKAKSLTFSDQSIVLRDLDELYRERKRIADAIAAAAGTSRTRYAATTKGV
jgi:hypothetical protein